MAKRWYIIHAFSNCESKVADSIREQVKHRHFDHLFEEIIVPIEKLVEMHHGQKHTTERKFFPGCQRRSKIASADRSKNASRAGFDAS